MPDPVPCKEPRRWTTPDREAGIEAAAATAMGYDDQGANEWEDLGYEDQEWYRCLADAVVAAYLKAVCP